MSTYETIMRIMKLYIEIWNHIAQYKSGQHIKQEVKIDLYNKKYRINKNQ